MSTYRLLGSWSNVRLLFDYLELPPRLGRDAGTEIVSKCAVELVNKI
jgi:hypothetical protein